MDTQSPPTLGFDPQTGLPAQPPEKQLLAPVWHTIAIIVLIVGVSFIGAKLMSKTIQQGGGPSSVHGQLLQYGLTIVQEFVLLGLVWIGLKLRKTKIRDLIGGRWNKPEDFLIDLAIAAGFWIVSILVLAGLGHLLGLAGAAQMEATKKLAGVLAPRNLAALGMFVALSCTAGFVEEIIFRGYLQRQIGILFGNAYVGLICSALVFGAGHGYEGIRRMVLIAVYGALFGFLTHWRKSLRPGMIAHAWHDSFEGGVLYFFAKYGFPKM